MASNTPAPFCLVGGTTSAIASTAGASKQVAADLEKNTLVLFDGSTLGGHAMAKEAVKIKAGTPNVKINQGAESDLSADITITVVPGTVPGAISLVENPEGMAPGQYLKFEYTNAAGNPDAYYVNLTVLVDTYTAGTGIIIDANGKISVNRVAVAQQVVKPDGGLAYAAGQIYINLDENSPLKIVDGKLSLSLSDIVDTSAASLLQVVDDKITLRNVVSADADNILQAGSDKLVFFPGDQGNL